MGQTEAILKKTFSEFGGVDYRANDVTRKERFARDALNIEYLVNNSLGPRRGQKLISSGKGGGGLHTYVYKDTNVRSQEKSLTIDSELYERLTGSFTLQYTGLGTNPIFRITAVQSGSSYFYQAEVEVSGASVGTLPLGMGKDDAAAVTVATLRTWLSGLASITVGALSGSGTESAASIPNQEEAIDVAVTISWAYFSKIYCPTSTPFSSYWTNVNSTDFENASLINMQDCVYIATGYTALYKYDAVSLYKAGMPAATALALGAAAGGGLTGTYDWFITYEQDDARGNVVEGDESNIITTALVAQQQAITIPQIQTSSGYLTSYAQVNGAQVGVTTITVDAAHTLQIGQTAFFRDNGGTLQERVITARANTTITIAGAVVTVADNEPISANLRVNLWRNKAGSTEIFYLVRTFANNSSTATVSYSDNVADASLGDEYIPPEIGHGLPPSNVRYLASFQNLLVMADGTDVIRNSDLDGPEYWNEGIGQFVIKSKSGGVVTGIGATREIFATFKHEEVHILSGTMGDQNFRVELLGNGLGCDSFASIFEVDTALWFYSGTKGVYRIDSTKSPDELSFRVLPMMTFPQTTSADEFVAKRVVGVNCKRLQLALFFLPVESSFVSTSNSRVFAVDYRDIMERDTEYDEMGRVIVNRARVRWWPWSGIDFSGGAAIFGGEVLFAQRHLNTATSTMEYLTSQRQENVSEEDFSDFAQPFDMDYEASWTDLDEPELLKNWESASILSLPFGVSPSFSVDVATETKFINNRTHSFKTLDFGESGGSAGWGNWPWGQVSWGESSTVKKIFKFKPTVVESLKLHFHASIWKTQPVLSGWTIKASPCFKPRILK